MNKKLLVLLVLFSITLAGCQKVEESENNDNNDNNGAISVQPIDKDFMSEEDNSAMEEENTDEKKVEEEIIDNNNDKVVIAPKPKIDPKACEIDMDCVAIPHPANACYKGYFNKNAIEAIDAYREQEGMMVQDCPDMGAPVCINKICTAKK